ncbi:MAG: NAD(P)-binding protein [Armatimonadetes bacterium]|nr:NAD(P)-binding protein [Armatimonadota bacterium]
MPDAEYDVVMVGAGTKTLNVGLYLAKYGGMQCAMFERHDEAGGCMAGEEHAVPGFINPRHAYGCAGDYWEPIVRDFPEEAKEFDLANPQPATCPNGIIFEEDHKCVVTYNIAVDPTQEKTAAKIARFSQKDADTWFRLANSGGQKGLLALKKMMLNPPPASPFEPNPLMALYFDPEMEMDPGWVGCSRTFP